MSSKSARACLSMILAIGLIGMAAGDTCSAGVEFTSHDGQLWANDQPFSLKGLNWFGFETSNQVVHGLWARDYHDLINFISSNGFNALRLPFNLQMVLNQAGAIPTSISFANINLDLQGLNSIQVMDKIIQACASAGIVIMFDLHAMIPDGFPNDGLWYDSTYSEAQVLQGWDILIQRYANQWNVIAVDLKNEPWQATWGTGDLSTDWSLAAVRIGNHIVQNSKWLVFVEGVANSPACPDACFWGEDFQGIKTNPISLTNNNKLVLSPHVYGPSVASQTYFSASNFPSNMPAIWDEHIGFLPALTGLTVVVGEWGGFYSGGASQQWMDAFGAYLKTKGFTNTFFWCLNPNSGDTGGILQNDWITPDTGKLALLASVNPTPTSIYQNSGGQVCTGGSSAASSSSSSSSSASSSASPATTTTTTTTTSTPTTTTSTTTSTPTTTTSATTTTTTTAAASSSSATSASATSASATSASATSGSSSSSSSSGSSTGGGSTLVIFNGQMNSAWTYAWSWQATISVSSSWTFGGTNSLQVQLQPWGGLQFGASTTGVAWKGVYTKLQFQIISSASATLDMWLADAGKHSPFSTSTSGWTAVSKDLANDLGATNTVGNPGGIIIFNNSPNSITIYVDAVMLA